MAILLQYQVGSCWSLVNPDEMAGCFTYFATLQDAAKAALDYGTGIRPLEVDVDIQLWGRQALIDYMGKAYKVVQKNWSEVEHVPVIRVKSVLEQLAGL